MPVDDLRRRHAGVLLAKLRETKYPSPTMLDRTEASAVSSLRPHRWQRLTVA